MEIYFASSNVGKIKEIHTLLDRYDISVKSLFDAFDNVEDVEETGKTFEENAILKAETYANRYQVPVLADDSGLEVYALDREPGVYSARYAGEDKDDIANMNKVLSELNGARDRSAAFVCVLAYAKPGQQTITTEGRSEGSILMEPEGDGGFGYDPIFKPDGYEHSFAKLGDSVKNSVSHRKRAMERMVEHLTK